MIEKKSLVAFANKERDRFETALRQFVDIPTVSADADRLPDIRRCAELAASTIRDFGGEADILETDGNPIIHGRFNSGSNLPTVTVYNHLDVQPASRETEPWTTDPFVFTKQGDRYLGRGTTDDKGPALTALFGIRAAREAGVKANMHLLWELEEEIGSPSFDGAMKKYAQAAQDRFGARLRHDLGFARTPCLSGRTARTAGIRADPRNRRHRSALRRHRRRSAQSDRRVDEARLRDVRRHYRQGEDQRLLRRRRAAVEEGAGRLPSVRLHREGVQERSRLQIGPHRRRRRHDEAHLGHADVRSARPGRRLHRPRNQDHHPAARRR